MDQNPEVSPLNVAVKHNPKAEIVVLNDLLIFEGKRVPSTTNNWELWVSDGTIEGTFELYDIWEGEVGSFIGDMKVVGDLVFFRADDGIHGTELWVTDGSEAGTFMLKDINQGSESMFIRSSVEVDGQLVFSTYDGISDGIWVTDGSVDGTQKVATHDQGISDLVYHQQSLYYSTGFSSSTLWRLESLNGLPVPIIELNFDIDELTSAGDFLFFVADELNNEEVWASDGTTSGTQMVKDIILGSSLPRDLTEHQGELVFTAAGVGGRELWKSDGTEAGTSMVLDINSSSSGSGIDNINSFGSKVMLTANDGINGNELWLIDIEEPENAILLDLIPGADWSNPSLFTRYNQSIFFRHGSDVSNQVIIQNLNEGEISANKILEYNLDQFEAVLSIIPAAGDLYLSNGELLVLQGEKDSQGPTDIVLSNSSLIENSAQNQAIGQLSSEDLDEDDVHTYMVVGGDLDLFFIEQDSLRSAASFDYEMQTEHSVMIQSTDLTGLSFTKEFAITIIDLNEVPTGILLSNNEILENEPGGTVIGELQTDDPDVNDTHTYSLIGENAGLFSVVGSELRSSASFNFESQDSYEITVQSVDGEGLSLSLAFIISILDDPDEPLGIPEAPDHILRLFPNPVSNQLNLEASTVIDLFSIKIFDLSGKQHSPLIAEKNGHDTTFDINHLTPGYYCIMIKIDDRFFSKRFIKK
ncbi:MAG: T9SS type A sorting domain-containing protein [Cyclobacteriaceae bacterium]